MGIIETGTDTYRANLERVIAFTCIISTLPQRVGVWMRT